RDEDVGHPAVGRAGRARIERSARDRSAQVPVEAAVDAGIHGSPVLALRAAGPGALAGRGQERAPVGASEGEAAVLVLPDLERALLGVDGPGVPTRAVVVVDHVLRAELLGESLAFTGTHSLPFPLPVA